MNDFIEKFNNINIYILILIGILLVAFLGITDFLTGAELSLSIFYLIPITIVTLHSGGLVGFIISIFSALIWLIADIYSGHQYSHWLIPYWNGIVRLCYFCLHTFLLTQLLRIIKKEKERSLIDPLTHAANWRYFEEYSKRELERQRRAKQPITIAYIDLDNFKAVNDTYGHDIGDELLRTVSQIIQSQLRPGDMLARMGGDEFALLLPATGFDGAGEAIARFREVVISEMKIRNWPVTLSIGAITFTVLPSTIGLMVKQADNLMYHIKHSGKNNLKHEIWPRQENST
jgi:diguanylate cyclase (GGDEF)-like protein